MAIAVGESAPDFSLKGTAGDEPVSLSSFHGDKNVVVLFFPFAFTGVCTQEMCTIRDGWSEYESLDATVLGISSADSPFALGAWAKEQGFSFPLLSDFNRTTATAFDVLYEDLGGFQGVSKRAAFVIDKEGVVRYAEECPTPGDLPSFDAIRETLSGLQ